jgi:hypothetical protein
MSEPVSMEECPLSSRSRAGAVIRALAVSLIVTATVAASPAMAQTPTAPANGAQISDADVVLRWTPPTGGWYTECVEWSSRPETSYPGGPFLSPQDRDCEIGPQDVAYLLSIPDVQRYYWHVQTDLNDCDADPDDCFEETWGPTAYFDSVAPPEPPPPTGCNTAAAEYMAFDRLLPYAHKHKRAWYRGLTADDFGVKRICRDLNGDGDREMIVHMQCCTGGSLSPWAIFKHDTNGQWRMRYADIKHDVFKISVRRRTVRAMIPSPYEGACTDTVRFREVRWRGGRFRSHTTKRHRVHSPC